MAGRSPSGPGSRASHEAASASSPEASIPNAGEWLVIRDWNIHVRRVAKVTPKLLKLGEGSNRYPTQISIGSSRIVCSVPDRDTAERVRAGVGGIDGEFNRRRHAANQERNSRVQAAKVARDKAVERLVASAMSASGQDPQGLEAKPASAVPERQAPDV